MKTKAELPECPVATTVSLIGSKWKLLMNDFTCTDPREMHYGILQDKAGHLKLEEEGVNYMCDFMEELRQAGRKEAEEEAEIKMRQVKAEAAEQVAKAKADAKVEVAEQVAKAKAKAEAEAAEQVAKAKAKAEAEAAEQVAKAEARNLSVKNALRMLVGGKLTFDEIAEYTNLSLDEVKEFAAITAAAK